MTDAILFHHAQGLTDGVREFADHQRAAGNQVTVPDLYDGGTFDALDDGIGYAEKVGVDTIIERGRLAAERLPNEIVYSGSRPASCPRSCWPRPGRAPMAPCCSMPVSRPPS